MLDDVTVEQVQELLDFLQGKVPDGVELRHVPRLSAQQAFNVIYILQEHFHWLPDNFEMCDVCHQIYDADCQGWTLDDQYLLDGRPLPKKYHGHYCSDTCAPRVDFYL